MAYTLQAIVGRPNQMEGVPVPLARSSLRQGFSLVPLTRQLREALDLPFLPITDEGLPELPLSFGALWAPHGPVAYVEAMYHGGVGIQAHVLFPGGGVICPPVISENAINEALRFLGVQSDFGKDEFESLGLGQHRDTESWHASTTSGS
jgi:hypothetical protein